MDLQFEFPHICKSDLYCTLQSCRVSQCGYATLYSVWTQVGRNPWLKTTSTWKTLQSGKRTCFIFDMLHGTSSGLVWIAQTLLKTLKIVPVNVIFWASLARYTDPRLCFSNVLDQQLLLAKLPPFKKYKIYQRAGAKGPVNPLSSLAHQQQ